MTIVVGVDAGGTRTTAAVSDGVRELARASGSAGAVRPGKVLTAAAAVAATVRSALTVAGALRADVLAVGAAGVGRDAERAALREALRTELPVDRIIVTTDIEIALLAAWGSGPGAVLLAGTGSFAVARLADGTTARQGGYGWQMGDEGGGYAIGREALRAAGRAHDGRGPETRLLGDLIEASRGRAFEDLVRWSVVAGPAEVAGLARTVGQAAAGGDAVAAEILSTAALELTDLVRPLMARLPFPTRVALGGGLLEDPALRREVTGRLRAVGAEVPDGALDPVRGALALALT